MENKSFCSIYFFLLLIILVLSIIIIFKLKNEKDDEYYRISYDDFLYKINSLTEDLNIYSKEKIENIKQSLINMIKLYLFNTIVRKLFKFLNNSNLKYLGKNQTTNNKPRKTITNINNPTLLQSLCIKANINKEQAKRWLIRLIKDNINDYIYEQWKLKNTTSNKLILKTLMDKNISFDELLTAVIYQILDNDFDMVLNNLMNFKDKNGKLVCSITNNINKDLIGDFGDYVLYPDNLPRN